MTNDNLEKLLYRIQQRDPNYISITFSFDTETIEIIKSPKG